MKFIVKRFFAFSMCFVFLFVLVGCSPTKMESGYYYLAGYKEEHSTPYVKLNFDDNSFAFGEGLIRSYSERGSFAINGERISATTQNTTFIFEIKDSSVVMLIDCGGYEPFAEYEGLEFVYHIDN